MIKIDKTHFFKNDVLSFMTNGNVDYGNVDYIFTKLDKSYYSFATSEMF